jgi:F0F1-type ATP synthase membrane subunit c/vacuolar-type H+-ATPase subunit K
MPPILAGILSIYGLVVAVIISGDLKEQLPIYSAFLQLGAGISVGLCGLAAGYVIYFLYGAEYLLLHEYGNNESMDGVKRVQQQQRRAVTGTRWKQKNTKDCGPNMTD